MKMQKGGEKKKKFTIHHPIVLYVPQGKQCRPPFDFPTKSSEQDQHIPPEPYYKGRSDAEKIGMEPEQK